MQGPLLADEQKSKKAYETTDIVRSLWLPRA